MHYFTIGQRWISETESDLGLGTIIKTDLRTVTVNFSVCDEIRTYAISNAPLIRITFNKDDIIQDQQQNELSIQNLKIKDNLYSYYVKNQSNQEYWIAETQINHNTKINNAKDRLFSGQIDADKWFILRRQTLEFKDRVEQSATYGLSGARIDLIPHQLYIASEVARRYSPRVLLADEVGLGKTIEACLILHQQYLSEAVQKILIIVPEALIHQWLVELLRRINMRFSLLDEQRCLAIEENQTGINPFETEQLVLCSLEQFSENTNRAQQVILCDWDMLIVDEAHHLYWQENNPSPEYLLIELLAKIASSVLLLTATPEQLGQSGHFARLRLLDPKKYHNLDIFINEEKSYSDIAEVINKILEAQKISTTDRNKLQHTFSDPSLISILNEYESLEQAGKITKNFIDPLINKLIDQHGTGRSLFRNSRFAVKGFPKRVLHAIELDYPNEYQIHPKKTSTDLEINVLCNLYPEIPYSHQSKDTETPWWQFDPRIDYLYTTLKKLKPQKVLIICANKITAEEIRIALKSRYGMNIAMFHEDMSIINRDRSAAFFADIELGSQALVCSEIGSEGRNFQFAHHMILFDLPSLPDLLEQRIGRLDRIGQKYDVEIHVLYLKNCAQELLFRWFNEGLNAFINTCPAGQNLYTEFYQQLMKFLTFDERSTELFNNLISDTKSKLDLLNQALQSGRDRLLELNSHKKHISEKIIQSINYNAKVIELKDYMELVFGCYGVDFEEHSLNQYIIRPSDHMHTAHFPLLPTDGKTLTFDRQTALLHEDIDFISWEHPMVIAVLDMISGNELGNSAVSLIKHSAIKSGSLLLECIYVIDYTAPKFYKMGQFFNNRNIHIVLDNTGNEISNLFNTAKANLNQEPVSKAAATQLVANMSKMINMLLDYSVTIAENILSQNLEFANDNVNTKMNFEIERLTTLQRNNPTIRDEEIQHLNETVTQMKQYIDTANLRLDAVRVIIVE